MRLRSFSTLLLLIFAHVCAVASTLDSASDAMRGLAASITPSRLEEKQVGPGVFHRHEVVSTGPLNFNVLRVDLTNPHIHAEVEQGQDRLFSGAKLTHIARRETQPQHSVVAAVNGDFWTFTPRPFLPVGMMVGDGTLWTMPTQRSVALFMADGRIELTSVTLQLRAKAGERELHIPRLNDARATRTVALYTHVYNGVYPAGRAKYYALKLDKPELLPNQPVSAKVARISDKPTGTSAADLVIIRVPDAVADESVTLLKKGRTVELNAAMPEVDGVVRECVGGGPRIVRDGRVSVEYDLEHNGEKFATDRHPRTAIGVSGDGKTAYLGTVDGRQPMLSIGHSLFELGDYMLKLGCADAINLDGGGSTSMVVRGDVVNRPSDLGGPRTVANAILLVNTSPPGPLAELEILPAEPTLLLPAGVTAMFQVEGHDANYNPVPVAQPKWQSNVARITAEGNSAKLVLSGKSADGTLTVSSGAAKAALPIRVEVPEQISVTPEVLVLASGDSEDIAITAEGRSGRLHLQEQMITVSPGDNAVSASASKVTGLRKGSGHLVVKIGDTSMKLPYHVDEYKALSLAEFDETPTATLTGSRYMDEGSEVALDSKNKKSGKGSLAFSYAMMKDGTSKIALPLDLQINEPPVKFRAWVYGDGKEAWLRADVVDSLGKRFLLDFTDGAKGIYWKNEWRHLVVPLKRLTPRSSNPGAKPQYPIRIKELYLAQEQEALKSRGRVLIDALDAIYPPK